VRTENPVLLSRLGIAVVDISNTITTITTQRLKVAPQTLKMYMESSSLPQDAVGGSIPPARESSTPSTSTLSVGGAIALAVSICAVLLVLCLTAVYFIYWRPRKHQKREELEIGPDGTKVKMQIEKDQRRTGWGRRGSGTSQETLVPEVQVNPPASAVVREQRTEERSEA
jgi:hypothetical protein